MNGLEIDPNPGYQSGMFERIFWLGVALACTGMAVESLLLLFYSAMSDQLFVNVFALVWLGLAVMAGAGAYKAVIRAMYGRAFFQLL